MTSNDHEDVSAPCDEAFQVVGKHVDSCPIPGITDSFVREAIRQCQRLRVTPVQAWLLTADSGTFLVTLLPNGEVEYWKHV